MRFLICLYLGLAVLAPQIVGADELEREIVVTGQGSVSVAPDMATIFVGVSAQGRLADAALSEASERGRAVLSQLEEQGIKARDIQTRNVSLNPQFARSNDGSAPRTIGYVATLDLAVQVRDFDRLGEVLDAVVADGANRMNGLSFGVSERAALETEARVAAVADARTRAETLAEAAGVVLGEVLSIREGGGQAPIGVDRAMMMEARAAVPIAGGEIDVNASVTMVFDIEDGE